MLATVVQHPLLSSLTSLLVLLILDCVRVALKRNLRTLPGPVAARFTKLWRVYRFGSGYAHTEYVKLHEKYGPIIRTGPNIVDVSDPNMIPVIYGIGTKFYKTRFYSTMEVVYENKPMDSMFTVQDPELHKALKRPVAQIFSMSSIRNMEPLVDTCSEIFTQSMMDLNTAPVDLGMWLQWYAFDVIGAITFNRRFGFMERREDIFHLIQGIESVLTYAGTVGLVPELHPWLFGNMTLRKLLDKVLPKGSDPVFAVMKMVQECIDEYDRRALNEKEKRSDFLALLRQEQSKNGSRMSNADMMNHLSNNLMAGSDTTGISMRAVFYHVMRNPTIYKRLQKEVDDADQAGRLSKYVTYGESLNMPYLQACMKEAMRIHPAVSSPMERYVPVGGADICGVKLSAGTVVGMNPAAVHLNKDTFGEDAGQFRPERWIDSDPEYIKAMDRSLLTFGYGTRTCLGKNISIMEIGKFIPQLMRNFDMEWASPEPEWQVRTFWFARQSGFIVKLIPRKRVLLDKEAHET